MCGITHKSGELGQLLAIAGNYSFFSLAYHQKTTMAGIYQSRVFKFINGQTNRFKNSLGQSWRQVKVSVQWTGQILLAPLRWLNWLIPAPESQIHGKNNSQLPPEKSTAASDSSAATAAISHQPRSSMTAADANQAIEALLATVVAAGHGQLPSSVVTTATHDDWSVIDENEWETAFLDESHRYLAGTSTPTHPLPPPRPVIQGLATLLSNQHLVLIDQHNQVLDVLSPSQQRHIYQQIQPVRPPALGSAAAQLSATRPTAFPPTQPLVVVTSATKPHSTLQKIGYWCKFYLEYFRVDGDDSKQTTATNPSSTLPAPLHKSWAITPTAITSITPPTDSSSSATAPPNQNLDSSNISVDHASTGRNQSIDIKTTTDQSRVSFQPQWIDTPSEALGYEKSLLHQLWNWLDRLMLKIENWIISIYQKLTKAR